LREPARATRRPAGSGSASPWARPPAARPPSRRRCLAPSSNAAVTSTPKAAPVHRLRIDPDVPVVAHLRSLDPHGEGEAGGRADLPERHRDLASAVTDPSGTAAGLHSPAPHSRPASSRADHCATAPRGRSTRSAPPARPVNVSLFFQAGGKRSSATVRSQKRRNCPAA
jgi:hypothetical protein